MISRKWLAVIWTALLVDWSHASQRQDNFGKLIETDESQNKFPPLPESFSCQAEIKTSDSADVAYARIQSNSRGGRVEIRSKNKHIVNIYINETNEIIIVDMLKDAFDEDACNVHPRVDPKKKMFFDDVDQLLHLMYHLDKQYIGPTTVRALQGDKLEGGVSDPSFPAYSLKVDWVIASNKEIFMPLQMRIVTKYNNDLYQVNTDSNIEFFEFLSPLQEDDDILLIPNRYYCHGKKNTRPPPKLANHFSFKSEIGSEGAMPNYLFEEYNFPLGLTRMDFYARYPYDKYKKYGKGLLTRIHDFNMNLEFIQDIRSGKCFFQTINESSVDTRQRNNTFYWRMRDPSEFFHLESNETFQYSGQIKTRGQLAHVFVSQRKLSADLDDNSKTFVNGTYTWFFVENKNSNPDVGEVDYIPIRMEYYSALENYDLNIYDFKTSEPTLIELSVIDCFPDLAHEQYEMTFNITRQNLLLIYKRRSLFKPWFTAAVAVGSKMSFLRVRMDFYLFKLMAFRGVWYVRFTLFERPSILGSEDTRLQDGVKALFESVNQGNFTFSFPNENNNLESIPVSSGALKKYTRTMLNQDVQAFQSVGQPEVEGGKEDREEKSGGISTGLIIFLMLATLMMGSVLGCGILYFMYRKNGRLPGGGTSGMAYVNVRPGS